MTVNIVQEVMNNIFRGVEGADFYMIDDVLSGGICKHQESAFRAYVPKHLYTTL